MKSEIGVWRATVGVPFEFCAAKFWSSAVTRGRKPKPRELRVVEGNPGKRPLPPPDPSAEPLGNAPRNLSEVERATWARVRRDCPWLRRADRMLVETYCRSWFQMVVADRRLMRAVLADRDPSTIAALQKMLDRARDACLRMMAEMGATATSRARVQGGQRMAQDDPASKYFA